MPLHFFAKRYPMFPSRFKYRLALNGFPALDVKSSNGPNLPFSTNVFASSRVIVRLLISRKNEILHPSEFCSAWKCVSVSITPTLVFGHRATTPSTTGNFFASAGGARGGTQNRPCFLKHKISREISSPSLK